MKDEYSAVPHNNAASVEAYFGDVLWQRETTRLGGWTLRPGFRKGNIMTVDVKFCPDHPSELTSHFLLVWVDDAPEILCEYDGGERLAHQVVG
jgi:hypothetical protein